MGYTKPVSVIIRERFSCRSFSPVTIGARELRALAEAAARITRGPCGTPLRFRLLAATAESSSALRGLGTYGFIRRPSAFLVGAAAEGALCLEDYGCALEELVLAATDLGLGSCWLGGSFTRSSFARALELKEGELLPAVAALGVVADMEEARNGMLRRRIKGDQRRGWEEQFFDGQLGAPLPRADAGTFCAPLDMVRLAPSASNRQPWRIVKDGTAWHFHLQRTRGYRSGIAGRILKVEDIQRVDMGIAMSHFDLTARERFRFGKWVVLPGRGGGGQGAEYMVSWEEEK
jgi:nitroreductase